MTATVSALAASASAEQFVARPCSVLLVRHGETTFNAEGRLQGRLESVLTDAGHAQAQELGGARPEVPAGNPPLEGSLLRLARAATTSSPTHEMRK